MLPMVTARTVHLRMALDIQQLRGSLPVCSSLLRCASTVFSVRTPRLSLSRGLGHVRRGEARAVRGRRVLLPLHYLNETQKIRPLGLAINERLEGAVLRTRPPEVRTPTPQKQSSICALEVVYMTSREERSTAVVAMRMGGIFGLVRSDGAWCSHTFTSHVRRSYWR